MNEASGGFMIARTYAELIAALSDGDAGRILKGLVCEFWGCGEKTDLSENPLVNALYNSVVQTAKEIDDNYQAQREQKREAGRKGGLAKSRKSRSDEAALSGAKECCDGAKLNKSKVNKSKENKTKENEMKESKSKKSGAADAAPLATPPSAVLTPENKKILIDEYGASAVEAYEQKFERWKASKKAFNGDAFVTISKWLREDKPENKPDKPEMHKMHEHSDKIFGSLNMDLVEQYVTEKYSRLC